MLSIMVRFRFDLIEINFPGLNLNLLIKRRTAYDFVILTTKPANTIYLGYMRTNLSTRGESFYRLTKKGFTALLHSGGGGPQC